METLADTVGFPATASTSAKEAQIHGHDWQGLTGTWNGLRNTMEENGITLEAVYTGEFAHNFNPGLVSNRKETIYLDNLDLTLAIDTEKAGWWSGGSFFVYGLYNHGGNPSADVIGDLQTASNIEAPDTFLIYEAWYEQHFGDDIFSLLVGWHDLNSEFYASQYSDLFLNSTLGIGPEISGNVAISIFSKTGLALRARIHPAESWYIQAAAYDGDPGTRSLSTSEGRMYIAEAGIEKNGNALKTGFWLHTADKTFNGTTFSQDYGYYGIIDYELLKLNEDSSIGAFINWGAVPRARNEIVSHFDVGLHMHGIIPTREEDDIGIAFIRANTHSGQESVYELTYRMVIMPWLAIQPSFQWIQNPGGTPAAPANKVSIVRFEINI